MGKNIPNYIIKVSALKTQMKGQKSDMTDVPSRTVFVLRKIKVEEEAQMANPQKEKGFLQIANELVEAFALFDFDKREYKIIWYILRQTYGYNRKTAKIMQSAIVENTGLKKSNVSITMKNLLQKNIIFYQIGSGEIGINKDYDNWQKVIKTITPKSENNQKKVIKTITPSYQNDNSKLSKRELKVIKTITYNKVVNTKHNIKHNIKDRVDSPTLPDFIFDFFKTAYKNKIGIDYKGKKTDKKKIAVLLKTYQPEIIKTKIKIFEIGCEKRLFWFTEKSGLANFTIDNLVRFWDQIVPEDTKENKEKQKDDQERRERMKRISEGK